MVVEVAQKLQFHNEYGYLETVNPVDRAGEFLKTMKKVSGAGP